MPGTTAVATSRATAVINTRMTSLMPTSCHGARNARYVRDPAGRRAASRQHAGRHVGRHSGKPRETIQPGVCKGPGYVRGGRCARGRGYVKGRSHHVKGRSHHVKGRGRASGPRTRGSGNGIRPGTGQCQHVRDARRLGRPAGPAAPPPAAAAAGRGPRPPRGERSRRRAWPSRGGRRRAPAVSGWRPPSCRAVCGWRPPSCRAVCGRRPPRRRAVSGSPSPPARPWPTTAAPSNPGPAQSPPAC